MIFSKAQTGLLAIGACAAIVGVLPESREAIVELTTGTERCEILNFDQLVKPRIQELRFVPGEGFAGSPEPTQLYLVELDCPNGELEMELPQDEWEALFGQASVRLPKDED